MAVPRILLVGAGSMGSLHARVISSSDSAELAALVDPREQVGKEVADRFSTAWRPELGDLTGIDGVVVAAATEAHPELARTVLEAGVPLLVEKPVASGLATTLDIIALSEERGVPMMCGLLERFNPAVLTAQKLVSEPVYVTAVRHSPYVPRIRTGVAWDLLVHDVDLAIRFLGEPVRVRGAVEQFHPSSVPGAEDVAEAVLGFADGGIAQVSASRIGQRKIRSLSIHDLDRLIEVDLLRRDVTVYRHVSDQAADPDGRGYRQQTVIEIPELVTSVEPLAAQLNHFIRLIAGTVDAEAERASIVPSHRVVEQLTTGTEH